MTDEQYNELMDKLNELNMNILALHRTDVYFTYSGNEDLLDVCNCNEHKSEKLNGELTRGWICPIHGQQF